MTLLQEASMGPMVQHGIGMTDLGAAQQHMAGLATHNMNGMPTHTHNMVATHTHNMRDNMGQMRHMPEKTFHTPSFGDEDFNIPSVSQHLSHPAVSHQVSYTTSHLSPVPVVSTGHQGHPGLSHQQLHITDPSLLHHQHQNGLTNGVEPVTPKFPPPNFDIPDIRYPASHGFAPNSFYTSHSYLPQPNIPITATRHHLPPNSQAHLHTLSHTQLRADLNLHVAHHVAMDGKRGTPPGSNTTSPGRESSEESSDDSVPLAQLALKRSAAEAGNKPAPKPAAKKQKTPKKRKKRDPNEPQKPVSAYALFFRDTQAAIKGQNPNASFGEVSKIVASMWDNLEPEQKNDYKKKTEMAKKEYLKQLAAYRASLVSKQSADQPGTFTETPAPANSKPMMSVATSPQPTETNPIMSVPPLSHYSPPNSMQGMVPPQQMGSPASMGSSPPAMANPMMQHPQNNMAAPMQQQSNMAAPMGMPTSPNNNMAAMSPPAMMHMNNQGGYQQGMSDGMGVASPGAPSGGQCMRDGCPNPAISNPAWDAEYCSQQCVVSHCRDVFTTWVASRQGSNPYASVK